MREKNSSLLFLIISKLKLRCRNFLSFGFLSFRKFFLPAPLLNFSCLIFFYFFSCFSSVKFLFFFFFLFFCYKNFFSKKNCNFSSEYFLRLLLVPFHKILSRFFLFCSFEISNSNFFSSLQKRRKNPKKFIKRNEKIRKNFLLHCTVLRHTSTRGESFHGFYFCDTT